jgi:hypothetical protein
MLAPIPRLLVLACVLVLSAACATSGSSSRPDSDWNGRIGKYKYDEAVNELGPPAQQKELPGGETVCTWPRQGNVSKYNAPVTSYGTTSTGVQDDDVVILTFDSRKVLVNCVTQPVTQPAPTAPR